MNPYPELMRLLNSLMAGFAGVIAGFLAISSFSYFDSMFFLFATVFFVTAGGNAINDYFDALLDRVNRPKRPIPSGRVSRSRVLGFSLLLFSLGIFFSSFINVACLLLALFNSLLLIVYNKIKRSTVFGNFVVAYLTASIFLFGGLAVGKTDVVLVMALLAFLVSVAREITKDIEDMKGDKGKKVTMPLKFGVGKSSVFSAFLMLVAVFVSIIPYRTLGPNYLVVVSAADMIFLYCAFRLIYRPEKYASELQRLEKLGMFIALFSFFVGIVF